MTGEWTKAAERLKVWGKKYKYAAIVLLAGLLLLLWPGTAERAAADRGGGGMEADAFDLDALEQRLEEALSQVAGVGRATVVLTLQGGGERILASDRLLDGDRAEESAVVISRGSGQQEAVTVQQLYPRFWGALVVCDGGGSPAVRLRVLESISALTGLSSDKISICERK